jgi:ribonuclease BN (tRNA processing enzyme)
MEIRILGAHNIESATSRLTCLLVDGILAVDAGALTSGLTFPEQEALKSILLTHRHYDHVRDIAAIGINTSFFERNVRVHAQADTLEALSAHFLNRIIYPDFTAVPSANPALTFCPLEPYRQQEIEGYAVLAVPTRHTDTVGYQVTSREGRSFFYTGDTGPGLSSCWEHVSPELLLIDVTLPNRLEEHALSSDHLTPRLLGEELALLRKARGHLPRIVPIHLSPMYESEIAEELGWVARELDARIDIAREDMRLSL